MKISDTIPDKPFDSLTVSQLQALPGQRFVGEIADVAMGKVRNKYKVVRVQQPDGSAKTEWAVEEQPVVHFVGSDIKLIPNIGARRALLKMFGDDTEGWRGKSITVFLRSKELVDKETGEVRTKFERHVMASERALDRTRGPEGPLAAANVAITAADISWSGRRP